MSEKHKSTSPGAIEVKNQWKTISTEGKLYVMSWFGKGEKIVDIFWNVRLAHSNVRTARGNADKIKESAKCF